MARFSYGQGGRGQIENVGFIRFYSRSIARVIRNGYDESVTSRFIGAYNGIRTVCEFSQSCRRIIPLCRNGFNSRLGVADGKLKSYAFGVIVLRKISDFGYRVILIDLTYHDLPRNTFAVISQFKSIHAVGGCNERTTRYRCGRFIGFSYLYRCVARRARQGDSLRFCPRRIICGRRKRQSYGGVSPRRRNGYIFIRRLSSPVAVRGSGVQIISTRITRRLNGNAKPIACSSPTARRNGGRSAPGVFYFNGVRCGNFTRNQTAIVS